MPAQAIPRPSSMVDNALENATDIDARLFTARYNELADELDVATGYAPTPGMRTKVRALEAEYERTYGQAAPRSDSELVILRAQHLQAGKVR